MAILGIKGKIKVNGTQMDCVGDLTIDLSKIEVAIKDKGSDFVRYLGGLIDAPIDIEGYVEPENAGYQAMEDAFWNDTEIEVEFTHGPNIPFKFIVTKFTHNEPVEDAMTFSASIRPSAHSRGTTTTP